MSEAEVSVAVAIGDHNFSDLKEFALGVPEPKMTAPSAQPLPTIPELPHKSAHSLAHILNPVTHPNDHISATPTPVLHDAESIHSSAFKADASSMDTTSSDIMSIDAKSSTAMSICVMS